MRLKLLHAIDECVDEDIDLLTKPDRATPHSLFVRERVFTILVGGRLGFVTELNGKWSHAECDSGAATFSTVRCNLNPCSW